MLAKTEKIALDRPEFARALVLVHGILQEHDRASVFLVPALETGFFAVVRKEILRKEGMTRSGLISFSHEVNQCQTYLLRCRRQHGLVTVPVLQPGTVPVVSGQIRKWEALAAVFGAGHHKVTDEHAGEAEFAERN